MNLSTDKHKEFCLKIANDEANNYLTRVNALIKCLYLIQGDLLKVNKKSLLSLNLDYFFRAVFSLENIYKYSFELLRTSNATNSLVQNYLLGFDKNNFQKCIEDLALKLSKPLFEKEANQLVTILRIVKDDISKYSHLRSLIVFGIDIKYDLHTRKFWYRDYVGRLTRPEVNFFEWFSTRQTNVITTKEIWEEVLKSKPKVDTTPVRNLIYRLRIKIKCGGDNFIHSKKNGRYEIK